MNGAVDVYVGKTDTSSRQRHYSSVKRRKCCRLFGGKWSRLQKPSRNKLSAATTTAFPPWLGARPSYLEPFSVQKVPHARKHHGHAETIRRRDYFGVFH